MSVSISDGPLGLESKFLWTPTAGDALTMNHLLNDAGTGPRKPRIKFKSVTGLRSRAESDDPRDPRTQRPGEIVKRAFLRGKTIAATGVFQATSLQELRAMESGALNSFADTREGELALVPRDEYYGGTPDYWYNTHCRVLQFDPDESFDVSPQHPMGPYQLPFTLSWRLSDARWKWTAIPATVTGTDTVTVNNLGKAPSDPTIIATVTGAPDTTTLTNSVTGEVLSFRGDGIWGFDFEDMTVLADGDDPSFRFNSLISTWWLPTTRGGLVPGSQDITATFDGGTSPSCDLSVAWKHTSW